MGRTLGIDFGRKRIGLAITDPLGIIATHLDVVRNCDFFEYLTNYLSKNTIETIALGFPKDLRNNPSESTVLLKPFLIKLLKTYPSIPVFMVDERFTSKIAQRSMIEMGMKKTDRQNKENLDAISAVIILQSYLEQKENGVCQPLNPKDMGSLFI